MSTPNNGKFKKEGTIAQQTKLGWIISGPLRAMAKSKKILSAVTNFERFWAVEEVGKETMETKLGS